jgi:pimeloyl-ACP methyl ester carboxylesterase
MQWQELRSAGRGVQLYVRRVVEPEAPPVLLLHGLGVGGAVWQAFARRLLPDLAAVAPDLRGHGKSDAPPAGYSPRDYALDVAALVTEFLEPPVPVIGNSLGALVGLALADLQTQLVKWLVLLDPPLDESLRNTDISNVYKLRHAGPGELEAYLRGRNPGSELLANLFREASDAAFEAMLEPDYRYEAWKQLEGIKQPCLVLQADPERGGVLGDEAAQRLAQLTPHIQVKKIDGGAHALHASHPAEVAQAIRDFYTSSPGSR